MSIESLTTREVQLKQEAHEELCALRYKGIDDKLDTMNESVKKIEAKFDKFMWLVISGMGGTIASLVLAIINSYLKVKGGG